MRLRAVVLLAFAALFSDATRARLAADPPPSTGETGVLFTIVPEDTRCPAATHVMKYCQNSPGTFVVFVNPNKRHNNLPIGGYCTVRGDEDLQACPPYRLIHVRRIEKLAAPPLPCEPPTYPQPPAHRAADRSEFDLSIAYDGLEVPPIAGFSMLPKNCIPESQDCPGDVASKIRIGVADPSIVWWASEWFVTSYNLYRGDLAVLQQTGVYTQDPGTVPLAARSCDVAEVAVRDDVALAPGQGVFYFVSGKYDNFGTREGNLGTNSAGWLRPNTNPCH